MEWSNAVVLNLIDEYRQRECLWNPKDSNYKSKTKKLDAWSELANVFKCDILEIKKKMESLQSSFRRERQKEETTTGMGAEDAYQSKWFAFKSLEFLKDKFEPRKTVNTEVSINNVSLFIDHST